MSSPSTLAGSGPTASLPHFPAGAMSVLVAAKVALHAATSLWRYGYFRDELYFLDLGRHLDWGYVDTAPLIAVYAKLALLLGGSLPALRILPALAGAALVAISMLIARELGGGRYAQFLAGACILFGSAFLVIDNILSMNAFEPLFWMGCIWVIIRLVRTGDSRLWVWFGVLAGLGLQNKHSTLFFGLAVTVALLLTEHRREFLKRWLWIAAGIVLLLFLPNLIWQVRHDFATLEDLENVRRTGKNIALSPLDFILQQIVTVSPVLLPVWLVGLVYFFRERRWRILAWAFVIFFLTMMLLKAKVYYVFPIYPMVLAGGAVAIERWSARRGLARTRVAVAVALVTLSLPAVPLVLPVFSPEGYLAYARALRVSPPKTEAAHEGPLPQLAGDQFGWEEMVREVAQIYNSLPPEDRAKTAILAGNYGEAGAINLFGPRYGLPNAISGHQNHWFWEPPATNPRNVITLQWSREALERRCESVDEDAVHYHPWGMAEENHPIYLCRGLTLDLREVWPRLKQWN